MVWLWIKCWYIPALHWQILCWKCMYIIIIRHVCIWISKYLRYCHIYDTYYAKCNRTAHAVSRYVYLFTCCICMNQMQTQVRWIEVMPLLLTVRYGMYDGSFAHQSLSTIITKASHPKLLRMLYLSLNGMHLSSNGFGIL